VDVDISISIQTFSLVASRLFICITQHVKVMTQC